MASSSSRDGPPPPPPPSQWKPRSCLCSPTTHPGSFRCGLHKNSRRHTAAASATARISRPNLHHDNSMRTTMKALILQQMTRPSSHDMRRRKDFQARPSRFCLMNSSATTGAPLAVS